MELRRCSCQDGVPIERHFARQEDVMTDAKSMRSLLAKLASADFECTVFTLTSVDRVCLLSQDDYSTPWWVIITSFPEEEFKIECRIPRSIRPWLSATLVSEESSADKACETVLQARRYCRGWDASIGGKPIGLAEQLDNQLSSFRLKEAQKACRSYLVDWHNISRTYQDGEVLITVLFDLNGDERIGYRHDSTTTRWGLLSLQEEDDDEWFWALDDAFFRSKAWPAGPPNDEHTYFWQRSRDG